MRTCAPLMYTPAYGHLLFTACDLNITIVPDFQDKYVIM